MCLMRNKKDYQASINLEKILIDISTLQNPEHQFEDKSENLEVDMMMEDVHEEIIHPFDWYYVGCNESIDFSSSDSEEIHKSSSMPYSMDNYLMLTD